MRDFGLLDSFETHHENYFSSGQVLTYKQKIVFTKIKKTKKKAQQECYHCDNFRNFFSNFRGVLDESNSETCSMRFLFFFLFGRDKFRGVLDESYFRGVLKQSKLRKL